MGYAVRKKIEVKLSHCCNAAVFTKREGHRVRHDGHKTQLKETAGCHDVHFCSGCGQRCSVYTEEREYIKEVAQRKDRLKPEPMLFEDDE